MDINTIWFVIIAVLFIGFFFLEGFDYGVGLLLPFLGRTDKERRALINTIGPVWDGNEVWMITAGAALFSGFPGVYASLTSSFYLAIILMVIGLIFRGVAFEYRSKYEDPAWRKRWDWALFGGSLVPAFTWGLTMANLMRGVAVQGDGFYYGGLLPLLNPFALVGGLMFVGLFLIHGGAYLGLKLKGELHDRALAAIQKFWLPVSILTAIYLAWVFLATDLLRNPGLDGLPFAILVLVGLAGFGWFSRQERDGLTFIFGGLAVISAVIMVFSGLYPRLMISTISPDFSLTIYNSAASPATQRLMSVVVFIFLPLVMLYQGWTYWIFRQRISPNSSPDELHY